MTVTSKWVALHEVSDYLAKGWREVQIIGGPDDAALMVSPEEPASEPAQVECPNCGQAVPHAFDHVTGWANGGAKLYICKPASEGGKVCPNCGKTLRENERHHWPDSGGLLYECPPINRTTKPVDASDFCENYGQCYDPDCNHASKPAQPEPAANSAQAINARAEEAFAEATRAEPASARHNLVTPETHPDLFLWVKPHAQMRDEAVAEAINTEPVAAVYIDSPGGQRNRVLTDETDKPVTADTFATDRAIGAQVADASALEPAAAEMPEAVRELRLAMDNASYWLSQPAAGSGGVVAGAYEAGVRLNKAHEAWWRTHAAQPAPAVAMTDELIRVLQAAELDAQRDEGRAYYGTATMTRRAIAAVRQQAAEAGKVRLPKVNEALWLLRKRAMEKKDLEVINEAQREVDAAEGRK